MSELVLEVSRLGKRYKDTQVLKDLSFALEAGSATALVGPEGAGKSTLVRILAGLELPEEGTFSLLGARSEKELCQARREVGFVLETPFGYETLTVYRNLELRAGLYGKPDQARLRELRKELRLTDRDRVGPKEKLKLLSVSAEKRYALACALLNRPRLLILDEPLTGVDKENLEFLTQQLTRLREEGTTLLISAPTADPLRQLCTQVLLLQGAVTGLMPMTELPEAEG